MRLESSDMCYFVTTEKSHLYHYSCCIVGDNQNNSDGKTCHGYSSSILAFKIGYSLPNLLRQEKSRKAVGKESEQLSLGISSMASLVPHATRINVVWSCKSLQLTLAIVCVCVCCILPRSKQLGTEAVRSLSIYCLRETVPY